MVETNTTSDDNTTTNKGVNVHSESLPARIHTYPETVISSREVTDIRNEIQNVLDLMGPTTPNITTTVNTSSEADNEESTMSVLKAPKSRLSSSSSERYRRRSFSANDRKVQTSSSSCKSDPTKDSMMAYLGTVSSNNFDHEENDFSCCDHNHFHGKPECMCMVNSTSAAAGFQGYIPCPTVQLAPSRTCEGCYTTPNKSTRVTAVECKKRGLFDWIKDRSLDLRAKRSNYAPCDLYKINICGEEDGCPPKRVVFDLVEGIPRPVSSTVATNTIRNPIEKCKTVTQSSKKRELKYSATYKDEKNFTNEISQGQNRIQRNIFYDSDGNTRVDYYYFDHGNAQYFHTTDTPPVMKCEILAERTERYTTRFWAEIFASIHIAVSFCVSFVLQLFKFLLYSILRPLSVGLMQMWSDYLFKPLLTTLFNGLIQPFLIFLYNIATSIRDLCDPIGEAFGYFCRELAVLFRAIRLCTYKKNTSEDSPNCGRVKERKCEC